MYEVFSRIVDRDERIQGIKICREAPAITHILYADDLLISCRANMLNATAVADVVEQFCCWLGQQVNKDKSHVLLSKNTNRLLKKIIEEKLSLKDLRANSLYLCNNLVFGRNKSKEFGRLKDRIQNRLEGWQTQLLSRVGKETLIKSVIQASVVYSMSTFHIPKKVCKAMDTIVQKFWWSGSNSNRFLAMKSWSGLCRLKEMGGLGFKKFGQMNIALLAKLG